jgi:predicted ATPase
VLGRTDDATRLNEAAVAMARRTGHPYSLAVALVLGSCQAQFARDIERARRLAEECVALSSERGFALWHALGSIVRGWAIAFAGAPDEGIPIMHATLDAYVRTGAILGLPYFRLLLADATIHFRQDAAVHGTLDAALDGVEATGERWIGPEIHRLRGELLVREGRLGEAEASLRCALKTARACGAPAWELRATVSLGRLLASNGREQEARVPLALASSHDSADPDNADRLEARELLAALS